jgi:hypothetical protein
MQAEQPLSAFEIDLTRFHRRTVTSFYSDLVTRPTGQAVRLGVMQQLVELGGGVPCLSILDFSQVRVLDYSCADEIVAKLLMRYLEGDRPVDAYFIARGLQEHHLEAVEAVLERHDLLLASTGGGGEVALLGPCDATQRSCWTLLVGRGKARIPEMVAATGLGRDAVAESVERFVRTRVAVRLVDGIVYAVPRLNLG